MKTRNTYYAMVASYVLTLLFLALNTLLNPPANSDASELNIWIGGIILSLFKALPLLIFIPGLIKQLHSTSAWISYMSMLYFVFAVLLVFTPGAGPWGWALCASTLVLFLSSMLYTRFKKADLRAAQ